MRTLEVWAAGSITPSERYAADQAMIIHSALHPEMACLRVFCSSQPGAALGRFHRRDGAAPANLGRRMSGGRTTPTGHEFLELTLAVSCTGWLDPGVTTLRPEQVLNRALRPLLGVLRSSGVDAFYPGRDLVTVDESPLASCSFTVLPDGVLLVDICLGLDGPLSLLGKHIRQLDAGGIAAIDPDCFDGAVALRDRLTSTPDQEAWVSRLADACETAWRCTVNALPDLPQWLGTFTAPDDDAYAAFLGERVAQPSGDVRSAASMTMLGVVEASARVVDNRLAGLEICGDLIAPAMTLTALSDACEGVVAAPPAIRRAVTAVLSQDKHFVLGLDDIDGLLCRLL
jgi:hypothetical protein